MNKDVIYIAGDDDIASIITKIEQAKERIVALVPPKDPSVLRSLVNIKLMAKAAADADKAIVLVTTDEAIIKLAATTHLPVTKDLNSAPAVPIIESDDAPTESVSEVVEEEPATEESGAHDSAEKTEEKSQKQTKPAKTKIGQFFQTYKRWCIIGAGALVLFVLVVLWATLIAPAVKIAVSIRTTSNNFSQNISFTTKPEAENIENGVFYLEEKKLETPTKIEFTATGTKNVGNKAAGELVVYHYFNSQGSIDVPAGTTFTHGGLTYTNPTAASITWDGTFDHCDNNITKLGESCVRSISVKITAAEPGEKYNVAENGNGWTSNRSGISVSRNSGAIAGGTDRVVTVVQQSDIDEAKKSITGSSNSETKAALLESINDDQLAIETSFKQTTSDIVSSPKLDEEVAEGVTPAIETTTTTSIYVIDKTKVEEFISTKARLADDQKIYRLGNPFIENFLASDNGFTGKLKTSYASGPKVTEEDILNKSKGRKIGEVQSILKSINGVSTVSIEKSFFWVNAVPDDPNKITINLSLEE